MLEGWALPQRVQPAQDRAESSDAGRTTWRRRTWQRRPKRSTQWGKATEALEYVERARGHLYAFHQLIGRADLLFEEAPAAWLAPGMLGRRRRSGGMSSPRRTPAPLDVPDRRGLRRRLLPSGPLGGLRARTASHRGSSPRARGGAATRRRVSHPRPSPQRRRKLADHGRGDAASLAVGTPGGTADHCRHVDPVGTHDRVGCTGRRAGARRSPHRRGATPIFGVACRQGAKRRNRKRRRRQRYPVFSSALAARLMGVVEILDAVAKAAGIAPRGG